MRTQQHLNTLAICLAVVSLCSAEQQEPVARLQEPQQQLDEDVPQPAMLEGGRSNLDFSNIRYGQTDTQQAAENYDTKDTENMNTDETRWGWGGGWGRGWGGRGGGWGHRRAWGGYGGWGYGGYRGYRGYGGYWGAYPYYGGWGYYG